MHLLLRKPPFRIAGAVSVALLVFVICLVIWEHALQPALSHRWPASPSLVLTSAYVILASLLALGAARPVWGPFQRERKRLQSWLDATWNTTDDGVVVADLGDGRILEVNETLVGWLGSEPRRIRELGIPSVPVFRDQVEAAGEGEVVRELTLATPDGGGRHLEVYARSLSGPEEAEICLLHLCDVTGDREAEELLQAQSRRFSALISGIEDIILVVDDAGEITYASPSCSHKIEYWSEQLLGRPVMELIHPGDRDPLRNRIAAVRGNPGQVESIEVRVGSRSGDYRRFAGKIREPRGWSKLDGRVLGLSDVSEERALEEELEAARDKHSRIFHLSPLAIFISDIESGEILEANEGFAKLFAFDRERVLGASPAELGIWSQRDRDQIVRRIRSTGSAHQVELQLSTRTGNQKEVLVFAERIVMDGRLCLLTVAHDITARKAAERKLEQLALFDSLTGLPNRNLFNDRLEHALERADRRDGDIAVLFLDLDRFKVVNDTLGHAAGDQLLSAAAQRILDCFRKEDTVARLGGDEFAALLEGAGCKEEVEAASERLVQALKPPFEVHGTKAPITASIGIAISSEEIRHSEDLLRYGDIAMYRAKEREGTTAHVFDAESDSEEAVRLHQENELREAIEEEKLRLHYQPIFSMASGEVVGAEALVRWKDEERGLVGPSEFIPLAEETGLIVPLGKWVLDQACRDASGWKQNREAAADLTISVNLSACQFREPGLLEESVELLRNWELSPTDVQLEVTETVVLEGRMKIAQLSDLGLRVAIDDFGTGYSSLDYLKKLSIHSLKVDRSFVSGIGHDANDEAIVRTILMLADEMDLTVIAEGIETEEQLAFLRDLGCEMGQGFFCSEPVPRQRFEELLEAGHFALPRPAS